MAKYEFLRSDLDWMNLHVAVRGFSRNQADAVRLQDCLR